MNEEMYWMFFSSIEGLGYKKMNRLLECFGNAEGVFKASDRDILKVEGLGKGIPERIVESRRIYEPADEYERIAANGIHYVSRINPEYPERLNKIEDRPNGLFYMGELPKSNTPAIAIVGSRGCSNYGRDVSVRFARELAKSGIDIISGMAAGVDGYSHRGALEGGGKTFALLGCGVDICYPKTNRDIYGRIPQNGGIISEYFPQTAPMAINFPRRNRLISALSDGILVVEAREKSGTWITVDMGLEQGKDIYAIPGRIDDALSAGCNRLIRQGARAVTEPADIIAELAPHYGFIVDRAGCGDNGFRRNASLSELTGEQKKIMSILDGIPRSQSELSRRTGLGGADFLAALTILELKGMCASVGGGFYIRGTKS